MRKYEESDDDSEESSSEEEDAPRKKFKKVTRRISHRERDEGNPWDRKVRSLRSQSAKARAIKYPSRGSSRFFGVVDSGADESCTPYEEILMDITASYDQKQDTPDVTLRTAS